jgi:hypothetical protein
MMSIAHWQERSVNNNTDDGLECYFNCIHQYTIDLNLEKKSAYINKLKFDLLFINQLFLLTDE